jgi:hypothetical protein
VRKPRVFLAACFFSSTPISAETRTVLERYITFVIRERVFSIFSRTFQIERIPKANSQLL